MFNIIVDSREQQPWTFQKELLSSSGGTVGSIINRKLDTGDYSIEGLENVLCIERKKSVAELATNITTQRFTDELERMSKFPYKFLILEFDYSHVDNYPVGSNIPIYLQRQIKISGAFITKKLSEIQIKYGIHVVFCGNSEYATYVAIDIMKRIYEIEINGKK